MKIRYVALAVFALMLLTSTVSVANAYSTDPCNTIINTASSSIRTTATYTGLISISLLVIMATLMIISVIYVIGTAFGISKATQFAKTEVLEALLTLIILVFIAGGMTAVDSAFSFIIQMSGLATSSLTLSTSTIYTIPQTVFYNTCEIYYGDAINQLGNVVVAIVNTIIYTTLSSFTLQFMPNGFGFSVSPLAGLTPLIQVTSTTNSVYVGIAALELGVGFLLGIIFNLFPLFLFLGVAFRSFPWTRALGGTMLALFISFYIFFPSLLYSFSSIKVSTSGSTTTGNLLTSTSYSSGLGGLLAIFSGGGALSSLLVTFSTSIVGSSLNILGIIISFVISLDMVEAFGDLLGAPSLTSNKMLSKVI